MHEPHINDEGSNLIRDGLRRQILASHVPGIGKHAANLNLPASKPISLSKWAEMKASSFKEIDPYYIPDFTSLPESHLHQIFGVVSIF